MSSNRVFCAGQAAKAESSGSLISSAQSELIILQPSTRSTLAAWAAWAAGLTSSILAAQSQCSDRAELQLAGLSTSLHRGRINACMQFKPHSKLHQDGRAAGAAPGDAVLEVSTYQNVHHWLNHLAQLH